MGSMSGAQLRVALAERRRKEAAEEMARAAAEEARRAAEQEAQDLRQREEEERMRVAEAEAREAARLQEEEAQKEAAWAKAHAEEKARHVLAANAALASARKLVASSSTAPSAEGAALDAAQAKVSRIALKWWLSQRRGVLSFLDGEGTGRMCWGRLKSG